MKPIRFYKNDSYGKLTFGIVINKKEFVELIQKIIVHGYIYMSFMCGLVAVLIMGTCWEKGIKPTTNQTVAMIICSFIFFSLIRRINPKKFDDFFIDIWQVIKSAFAKIPRIFA